MILTGCKLRLTPHQSLSMFQKKMENLRHQVIFLGYMEHSFLHMPTITQDFKIVSYLVLCRNVVTTSSSVLYTLSPHKIMTRMTLDFNKRCKF